MKVDLPQNPFKRALKAGQPQIGLWSSLSSNYSVEVIAGAGFDWILLDMEHSPNDLESLLSQLQAAAPYASHPVVRVPWNDMVTIKRVLDAGAQSLLIPYVQNASEAKAAVANTRCRGAAAIGKATPAERRAIATSTWRSSLVRPMTDGIMGMSRGRNRSVTLSLTSRATSANSGWVHTG